MTQPDYVPRTLAVAFRDASRSFPIMMVTGARQVGKTTFLREISEPQRQYVSLDEPVNREMASREPALFLQSFRPPLLIDEIQYAPQLLPHLKMAVDQSPATGQFWLTGSQQFHLMKNVSESLAGRVGIFELHGLSHREATGRGLNSGPFLPIPAQLEARALDASNMPEPDLYRRIWTGSFPRLHTYPDLPKPLFHESYVQTYLQRDVRDLTQVGDEMTFFRFLRATAARSGHLLNFSDLARDADIAPNTAKSWLSILRASNLIYLLEPYHSNLTKRLVKAPKLYFLDTGLAAWLTEWATPEVLAAGAASGPLLETWVVAEILKSWRHNGLRAPLWYFRDRDSVEIDLLIVQDGTVYPIEIKRTASPHISHVRSFDRLTSLGLNVGPGALVCLYDRVIPLTRTATVVPVSAI